MVKKGGLSQAMANLEEEKIKKFVKEKIEAGVQAKDILRELQSGMVEVGNLYEKGEYFISELMYAGEITKEIMADLEPILEETSKPKTEAGKVVIGTVQGDIHDIGKDTVVLMLRGAGFEVIDLGVNVPPKKFVEAVKENGAIIVGMSVFLTMVYESATETVNAIKEAGLRDKVSIMIGGGPVTELVREKTGCDFYGKDAFKAVKYAKKVMESKRI